MAVVQAKTIQGQEVPIGSKLNRHEWRERIFIYGAQARDRPEPEHTETGASIPEPKTNFVTEPQNRTGGTGTRDLNISMHEFLEMVHWRHFLSYTLFNQESLLCCQVIIYTYAWGTTWAILLHRPADPWLPPCTDYYTGCFKKSSTFFEPS